MKKILSVLMVMAMFLLIATTQVFAAELPTESEVMPYGSLSGYGQHWYQSGDPVTGTFNVPVTGISWTSAQITLSLEDFKSDVCVQVIVYRPDGSVAFNTADTQATYMTMANSDQWHNIKFLSAPTGNYTVWYSIWTFNYTTPDSSRINCWIY